MGIFQKSDNYYIDYYANGRRRREKVGKSRKLAETVLAKRKVQVAEGKFLDIKRNEKIKFGEMTSLYLKSYCQVNNKISTVERKDGIISHLNSIFGLKYVYEITTLDVEEYKRKRIEEGKALATVNKEISVLRNILNTAVEWGKLRIAPPKIKLLKENNQRIRYLGKGEEILLLGACPEFLKPIIEIALNTGMRRGEILGLKWQDIDFDQKNITLSDTKNGERRQVPMNSTVVDILSSTKRIPESDYVFPGNNLGTHISKSYISHKFKSIVKQADIENFKFHDLRHTFASRLVMRGVNLKAVQELLGHKTFNMTLRYAHLSPDHKKTAVELLVDKNRKSSGMDTIWTPEQNEVRREIAKTVVN
ncbi:MAG: site-specific integrase [Candidatus Ratteibacteria bacterium]|jgi:integrase